MTESIRNAASTAGFALLTTAAMYLSVLAGVRLAGRRTVAQLSAFDAVVTVALGSMLATAALSPTTSYLQGMVGVGTLLLLQVAVAALRRRFAVVRRLVDFEPRELVVDGEIQSRGGVWQSELTDDELRSALRKRGIFDIAEVEQCLFEPTGEVTARRRGE